jgi:hypothetical protein
MSPIGIGRIWTGVPGSAAWLEGKPDADDLHRRLALQLFYRNEPNLFPNVPAAFSKRAA